MVKMINFHKYNDLFKVADSLLDFIFRGEGSVDYHFKSTLERALFRLGDDAEQLKETDTILNLINAHQ
jgi:hypothetical protein